MSASWIVFLSVCVPALADAQTGGAPCRLRPSSANGSQSHALVARGGGCTTDVDCAYGETCVQGTCMPLACPTDAECNNTTKCAGGESTDVRWADLSSCDFSQYACFYPATDFNQDTLWPPANKMFVSCDPATLLAEAMNPGLGIRELHSQGITGVGVNVAIIDQPMYLDHPEFVGKIAAYHDVGTGSESSMHGPAVASLLVGTNCGTAPGARLYFAAAPSWLADAAYYAEALDWIVDQNAGLPSGEKIRIVSVSANPSGLPFEYNNELWNESRVRAEAAGIVVLDASDYIGRCWYDANDPEDVTKCTPGVPGHDPWFDPAVVLVPASPRTVAEQYDADQYAYAYWGRGGLSWSIPNAAGVMALGWQLRPELTGGQMRDLLFQSAFEQESGAKIINPRAFVRAVMAAGVDYSLTWNTIDSGGEMYSIGSGYKLAGTIGQPDPGIATRGDYRLAGGFWGHGAADGTVPDTPQADPTGLNKSRFISFSVPSAVGGETALRVKLVSLHHVDPPYTGGASVPFTAFEGQVRWVGPPTQYVESVSSGTPFYASQLQCDPYYQDWSTVGLLHVTGSAIVPSSRYEVENLAASCLGSESGCTAVSAPFSISTTRWGDVVDPFNPPSTTSQPDFADIGALVNKFKSALGAPIKARALLAGTNAFGDINLGPDLNFTHIAACVDAFKGLPYPYTIASCP